MNGLAQLIEDCGSYGVMEAEYYDKMIHRIPPLKIVEREKWLVDQCRDKRVINYGCASGKLHEVLKLAAKELYGVDKVKGDWFVLDCDDLGIAELPSPEVDLIVCGEFLEHLRNPGFFLDRLVKQKTPVLVTVPNAFSAVSRYWVNTRKIECVNAGHYCYYSYRTIRHLLESSGFEIAETAWYNGRPRFSEGLVVRTK